MADATTVLLADVIRRAAHPLTGAAEDYDKLLQLIGDARLVLIALNFFFKNLQRDGDSGLQLGCPGRAQHKFARVARQTF
jgi:hypothetical protein